MWGFPVQSIPSDNVKPVCTANIKQLKCSAILNVTENVTTLEQILILYSCMFNAIHLRESQISNTSAILHLSLTTVC